MGHNQKISILPKPSLLLSFSAHAVALIYLGQSSLTTEIPASGIPQVQRVSLVSHVNEETPKPKQRQEKIKKTVTKKKKDRVVEQVVEQKQSAAPPAQRVDQENPHYAPTPRYPGIARMRGLEGEVVLKLAINSEGVPVKVDLVRSSGHKILDKAALEGLKKWRFASTSKVSESIAFWTEKTVKFRLQ